VSPAIIGALGISSLLVLLFVRVPVWAALTLVGFAGNFTLSGLHSALSLAGTSAFDVSSAYTLSVIPLFVLLGEVASNTRLSADLFNAARLLLSGVRGGLAIATIAASSCFGAVCGSSIVTAATMTRIALPEMRKAGYDDRLATGALAAGGSIGILIPPSIILVIYASIAEQSVPKLFAAALLPGLLLTALYMTVAIGIALAYPHYAPRMEKASARERFKALAGPWQFILLFVITIGGIYAGVFSPTEAAAIGAFGSIVLGFLGRRLTFATLWRSIETSITTSCLLFVIIIGGRGFHGPAMRETVLHLMLSISHDSNGLARDKAGRRWDRRAWPLLAGKTAAVIGTGVAGSAIGSLLQALEMQVVGVSRTPRQVAGFDTVVPHSELSEAAAKADYVVNVLPADAANLKIIGSDVFARMKPGAYFINVGRGETVDEEALIEVLRDGRIAGAGLDVFATEPLPAQSPLWDLANVFMSPHIGGLFEEYQQMAMPLIIRNMSAYLSGRTDQMANVIDRSRSVT
jgi:C4-dicarboxylate transporter DctM subunit